MGLHIVGHLQGPYNHRLFNHCQGFIQGGFRGDTLQVQGIVHVVSEPLGQVRYPDDITRAQNHDPFN